MTPVVVFGAKRLIGQTLLSRLANHPFLSIKGLADLGPPRAPQLYGSVCDWQLPDPMPDATARLMHHQGDAAAIAAIAEPGQIVLSVLPDGQSEAADRAAAARGARVVTHAEEMRDDPDIPLVLPDVFGEAPLAPIIATPNCTTVFLALALAPILKLSQIDALSVVTLQALSGADLDGPSALSMMGNVDPHLRGEEHALESEMARLFGDIAVSVQSARVPVSVGHTLFVSLKLAQDVPAEQLISAWRNFCLPERTAKLPTALPRPIVVWDEPNRPQVVPDATRDGGMAVSIGALRPCPVHGWRFVIVGDNLARGSAATVVLAAEQIAS